jgi:hypothetical protein
LSILPDGVLVASSTGVGATSLGDYELEGIGSALGHSKATPSEGCNHKPVNRTWSLHGDVPRFPCTPVASEVHPRPSRTAMLIPVDALHQAFDAALGRLQDFAREERGAVETQGNA